MAHQFFFNPYILDNLPSPATGFDVVQDLSEPRLRMYITSHGVKTFFVRKRVHGRDTRIIIGNYPDVDIESARAAVTTVLENAAKKPIVRRKQITFKQMVDLYIANRIRRNEDSQMKLVRSINMHLSSLFDKLLMDISRDDVANVIGKINGRAIAARMQDLLQSILKYAIEQGYKCPRVIEFVDSLPMTISGKIRRAIIRTLDSAKSTIGLGDKDNKKV